MIEKLKSLLQRVEADYADIRYETKDTGILQFSNEELTAVTSSRTDGYVIRILKDGGFAAAAFTAWEDAEDAINSALQSAAVMGEYRTSPVVLAEAEIVKDRYRPVLIEDPRQVSLEEKIALMKKYVSIPLQQKEIINVDLTYADVIRERYFVNSEGSEIFEELVTTVLSGDIKSKRGNVIQNVRISAGGSDGFQQIRDQEANFEKRTGIAIDLLSAEPVKGGKYNCILNHLMTGVFTHEAFGHFSEADLIESLPAMREKMEIGNKLGSDLVNIIDDATQQGLLGYYKYDDEGVPVRKVELMKNGVLTGRLHSRRTAADFAEPVSGHNIAEDFRYAPIIRMGTIYIDKGTDSFEVLLQKLGNGIYLCDPKGGQTAGDSFTFGAQYGYEVKDGKLGKMLRDINVSGNLYETLQNITAIGDDLKFTKRGGCGKGQTNIRSCFGGPQIIVNNLVIGGN
ncbi:MAG: TldD/PmbA family protein [Candidatus Cloacimonetes bacterium]|nr:TldD/PmbA family protein [Candidatus Cloacimonadota bacterium]